MSLPQFNAAGDLPEGVHRATLEELLALFGEGTSERRRATAALLEICRRVRATSKLERMIVFGSYVTSKRAPRDVDIILVMRDDFDVETCDATAKPLFEHRQADEQFGASVFWIRPSMLLSETLESFVAYWQTKRDGGRRGIVEVIL